LSAFVALVKYKPFLARRNPIRKRLTGLCLTLALASTLPVGAGDASTQQTTFQVTANVEVTCDVSATDLDFGTYNKNANVPLDAQSNIEVDCTKGANWNLGLDKGLHGADVEHRAMANDTDTSVLLEYAIFQDPAHTLNWGETVGVDTVSGTGTGVVQEIGAYGEIPKRQTNVTAGGYADTITATLTF
jgi:spore coat protein U-like protein